ERPDVPFWSEQEFLVEFQHQDEAERLSLYSAFDGDEMVGTGFLALPLVDNRDKCFLVVWTKPELRRRGIGSALLASIVDVARERGRTTLLAWSNYSFEQRHDHPNRRFAEKNGFVLSLDQVRRELELPVPQDQIDGWIEDAAGHHDGYELRVYEGMIPDDLLE